MARLTEVELFYVDNNINKMNPGDIAKAIGCKVQQIRSRIKLLEQANNVSPVIAEQPKPKNKFATKEGIVIMTAAQSKDDDDRAGTGFDAQSKGIVPTNNINQDFMNKFGSCIGKCQ